MVVMASSISTPCELLSGTNAAGSGSASAATERAIILVLRLGRGTAPKRRYRVQERLSNHSKASVLSRKKDQDSNPCLCLCAKQLLINARRFD